MEQDEVGWYYEANGRTGGPISTHELRMLFGARKLHAHTIVWTSAVPERRPAGTLPATAAMIPDDGGALNLLLPLAPQSGLAIAAGYLGIFSLFLLPGPIALTLGIFALRDLKQNPHKRGVGRAYTGIVMGAFATIFLMALLGGLFK